MKAIFGTLTSVFLLGASLGAQQVLADYTFEASNTAPETTAAMVTASEITATNTVAYGGNAIGDRWFCLTTDWNDVGGSVFFTVTPVAGQSVDFTRISWDAVTNNTNLSDSIASIEVYADGVLVGTVAQTTHNTTHTFDLSIPSLKGRTSAVEFEMRMTGNPSGQSSYEIDGIVVESAFCVENLATDGRVVWLPIDGINNRWMALDGAGFFELADGTARLKAALINVDDPELRISLCATLTGRTEGTNAPDGSPRVNSAVTNAGIDTNEWRYYTAFTGDLTGRCKLQGFEATIDRRGEALQIGTGANLKDLSFGLASWFNVNVTSQAPGCPLDVANGDFNLTLGNSCECFGGEVANWANYGEGTPSCNGVPSFTLPKDPLTNTAVNFTIGNDTGSGFPCAVFLSGAPDEVPFPLFGGTFLVEFPLMVDTAVFVPPGGMVVPCFVQPDPCIVGDSVYLQAICLDTSCPTPQLAFSRGLRATLGDL